MAIKQTTPADLSHWLKHMCMPLFDIDRPVEYRYWKSGNFSFQIRCIGGPGSGKTTLSHIIIKDLECTFQNDGTVIISTFLQPPSAHPADGSPCPISTQLLLEIQRQLEAITAPSTHEKSVDRVDADAVVDGSRGGDEILHEWIRSRIKTPSRKFLIIDDLDLAYRDIVQYKELESTLSNLQSSGFRILTTSRVPYRTGEISACDVEAHTGPAELRFWWECKTCGPEVYDLCHVCMEAGHGCNQADHAGFPLVLAPAKVQMDISHFFLPDGLRALVRDAIQREHGDLALNSSAPSPESWPPLSSLGQELITPANKAARTADDLVNKTVDRAGGNVTVARIRLDHIGKSLTLKEARAVGDRLPRDLVRMFETAICEISNSTCGIQEFLGLYSIYLVGKDGGEKLDVDLIDELYQAWNGDETELEGVLEAEDAVEQILFAARGFLTSRKFRGGAMLACFQVDFRNYVAEDYSEVLSRLPWST